ncbi:MAG: thiamine diphosphokinase, partial [Allorhizobium sp.]
MNATSFTLLLGGNLTVTDRLRALTQGSRVIAADSGMRHAVGLGLTPELWVGDFDSSDSALIDRFPSVERRTYPAAKAVTDGEIAVGVLRLLGCGRDGVEAVEGEEDDRRRR